MTTTTSPRRAVALLATLVLTSGVLAGCADEVEIPDDPAASASADAETTPADAEPSGEESGSTSGTSVEPATGKTLRGDQFTVRIPKGWEADPEMIGVTWTYDPQGTSTVVTAVTDTGEKSLDEAAEFFMANVSRDGVRRLDDATLGGEPAFVVTAEPVGDQVYESYGLWRDGQVVTLEFDLTGSDAERTALRESVLATWQWS